MKVEVGTRVKLVNDVLGKVGTKGTIIYIDPDPNSNVPWAVKFDDKIEKGHDLGNCGAPNVKYGYGYWCHRSSVEIIGKRGRPAKEKPVQYVVFYDENDHDPMKTFTERQALVAWLKEAREDEDIDFGSIRVFEVKKELKVTLKTRVNLS